MDPSQDEVALQRNYYASTAASYNAMHLSEGDEHYFALALMLGVVDLLGIRSILDIGAGTGRAILEIKKLRPDLRVVGVEPVSNLREIGYANGIPESDLLDGDALALKYEDQSFDLVCEFGVLHHIREPEIAVAEMLRVASKGIFLSDSNNFGQGSPLERLAKQTLDWLKLWPFVNSLKTGGRGYSVTAGDGLGYSYSVFNNFEQIRRRCERVHVMNTKGSSINPYRGATHVALLGVLGNDS